MESVDVSSRATSWPSPWRAALPYAAVLPPLCVALAGAAVVSWRLAIALAGASLGAGAIEALVGLDARRRLRERADELLALGAVPREASPLLLGRAVEVTSVRVRRAVARSLRAAVRQSEAAPPVGGWIINRRAIAIERRSILRLAGRIADLERGVSPRGMVLTLGLLSDGSSPLYDVERTGELGDRLAVALEALDPLTHRPSPEDTP
jgi:hypothetical protein